MADIGRPIIGLCRSEDCWCDVGEMGRICFSLNVKILRRLKKWF